MVVTSEVEILANPLKSPSDRKEYRLIKLPNGLKVLLVRNGELIGEGGSRNNSAAVALSVDVGSFDDPQKIQGLSHFLEHMVSVKKEIIKKINERFCKELTNFIRLKNF